jgi:hypothetical protein
MNKKGKFINFEFNIYIYSMKDNKLNLSIFFGFLLIAFLGILYGNEIKSSYDGLRIWSVENILWLGTVIPFLMLQSYVGIPNLFQRNISIKKRLLQPILIGAAFGILDILVIKIIQHPQPYTELPPFLQPFPYSIFLYFSGALEIEVFYRLIPITLMLLIGKKVSNGYYFNYFLWFAIITTSLREPIEQLPSGENWYIAYALLSGFLMNYLQGIYYKNAGFISSLTLRLGHYLFWHILLGFYVQYFEILK